MSLLMSTFNSQQPGLKLLKNNNNKIKNWHWYVPVLLETAPKVHMVPQEPTAFAPSTTQSIEEH